MYDKICDVYCINVLQRADVSVISNMYTVFFLITFSAISKSWVFNKYKLCNYCMK